SVLSERNRERSFESLGMTSGGTYLSMTHQHHKEHICSTPLSDTIACQPQVQADRSLPEEPIGDLRISTPKGIRGSGILIAGACLGAWLGLTSALTSWDWDLTTGAAIEIACFCWFCCLFFGAFFGWSAALFFLLVLGCSPRSGRLPPHLKYLPTD